MKILFCIGSLEKGGAERVISNLANSLCEKNEITIVTTIDKIEYKINKKIRNYSLENENEKSNRINRIIKLYNIINKEKPDIIISFLPEPSYRVLLLRKIIKIPIIVSVRNDPQSEYQGLKRKILMKLLYPLADGFVFQTEEAKQYFSRNIQEKSTTIPNPIKKEFLERNVYKGKKEHLIVSVGRLEKQKNHELLIDAFYDINKEIKDYKLVIYGEGTLRSRLEDKIKELNMQNRIFLPGTVDNIAEKIENAKLFIMTSNYEGMPNALMEAMALGLICISTDCPCGGPRYLIDDKKNGFLFKVNDKVVLNKIIKKVLLESSQEELKNISKCARKSTYILNEQNVNKLWNTYINSVLDIFYTREEIDEKI